MNRDLVKEAQDGLFLLDVYVRESRSWVHEQYDPKSANAPTLAFQHKSYVKRQAIFPLAEEGNKLLRFYVATGLRLLPADLGAAADEDLDKHVKAEITAEFVSEYRIVNPNLAKDAIEEFGNYNTMLHVWPYWRELIQSSCARMHLPQIVLPMYRVARKASEAAPKASTDNNQKLGSD